MDIAHVTESHHMMKSLTACGIGYLQMFSCLWRKGVWLNIPDK